MLSSSSSWKKREAEVVMEKKKYPIGAEYYSLYEEVGQGASASVHRAHCIPFDEIVAVKILDFERDKTDLNNISREAQTMTLVDHPNVLKSHCSFVSDHNLWVIMPFMSGGSCHHILKAVHPDGFEEVVIATILREVLKGLEYLHHHGHMHRDVKAGNIVLGARGSIKLADFGVSACLFDSGDRQRTRNTFVGTPCWMAPEVMQQLHGYDCKADIWSFGITAMELAHGHAPFSKLPPMKVLLMTIQNAPPGLDNERDRKFSKSFKQMIASCLVKDPSKRPNAKKLLKHSFFKQARSNDYIARTLLDGLPDLGDRIRALKIKEEEMLAQQIMPDGEKEELSQNEYKRGISGWNFDLEDVKAQAALIQDEDPFADNNEDGSSSSMSALDQDKHLQCQVPSIGHLPPLAELGGNDNSKNLTASLPPLHSNLNIGRVKCEKSDDDSNTTSPTNECSLSQSSTPCHNTPVDNISAEKPDVEMNGKFSKECSASRPEQRRVAPSDSDSTSSDSNVPRVYQERDKLPNHPQSTTVNNGVAAPPEGDVTAETGEELAVVQQRGRFKVTSENVELEKAAPSPMLHKSYSMQVISQRSSASLPSPPSDATPSNHLGHSFLPMLNHVLQTNISQTEAILGLIKRASATGIESTANHDVGRIPPYINVTEKSMMEAAHDREKNLINEINELNRRLICAQEELQKIKAENSQVC